MEHGSTISCLAVLFAVGGYWAAGGSGPLPFGPSWLRGVLVGLAAGLVAVLAILYYVLVDANPAAVAVFGGAAVFVLTRQFARMSAKRDD